MKNRLLCNLILCVCVLTACTGKDAAIPVQTQTVNTLAPTLLK